MMDACEQNLAGRTEKYGPLNRPITARVLTERYNKKVYVMEILTFWGLNRPITARVLTERYNKKVFLMAILTFWGSTFTKLKLSTVFKHEMLLEH